MAFPYNGDVRQSACSMTGDGAVVRQDEARAYAERLIEQAAKLKVKPTIEELEAILNGPEPQIYMNPDGSYNADGDLLNLARHALAQAAEIERLTRERDEANAQINRLNAGWDEVCTSRTLALERAEASEARNADLLKALERYGEHIVGECAKWHQPSDYSGWMRSDAECTCGLAAAKGETV